MVWDKPGWCIALRYWILRICGSLMRTLLRHQKREQLRKHESDGHGESVSEGSSTPVNRWMIIRNGNYHEEEPPISPAPPVFHPTHIEGHNSLKEEESPTPIPTIDKSHQSDPTTALGNRGDRQAQAEDVGWSGAQARTVCL